MTDTTTSTTGTINTTGATDTTGTTSTTGKAGTADAGAGATANAPGFPDLDALYAPPSEHITRGVMPHLIGFHVDYIKLATFFCLATGRAQGLDASPRGGRPGFVQVLDPKTVAFADWPGNNRIESLRNLREDPRVGLLFIFPGLEVFLRINGSASVSTQADVLARFTEGGKTPKTAIVIHVDEVLFHCGKAINRARLWAPESQLGRDAVPSVGKIVAAMAAQGTGQGAEQGAGKADVQGEGQGEGQGDARAQALADATDAAYTQAVRNDLY